MQTRNLLLAAFVVLPMAALAATVWFLVPRFAGLFEDFGAELPLLTRLVVETYRYWSLLAAIAIVAALARLDNQEALARQMIVTWVLAPLLFGLCVYAMYAPVFQTAATE